MADLHDDSIKTSLWRISAHDRINSLSNTSAFTVDIPSGVESFRNVIAIQLISATIPSSFYNIDTYDLTQSDPTLEFWYNGVPITLVIPRGQYVLVVDRTAVPFPANDLLTVIENEFASVTGSSITWSYDTVKNLLTLTHASNTLEIKQDNLSDINIWDKLGFQTPTGPALSITGETLPNISGPQELFIHVNQLANNTIDLDRENGISLIGNVFIDSPFGSTNHYDINSSAANLIKYRTQRTIDTLSVRIRDSRGRLIDLNGQDWTMIIKSYYIIG
jgi:hypothetical protein